MDGNCFKVDTANCKINNCNSCYGNSLEFCDSCQINYINNKTECNRPCFDKNCSKCFNSKVFSCQECKNEYTLSGKGECLDNNTITITATIVCIVGIAVIVIIILLATKSFDKCKEYNYLNTGYNNNINLPYYNRAYAHYANYNGILQVKVPNNMNPNANDNNNLNANVNINANGYVNNLQNNVVAVDNVNKDNVIANIINTQRIKSNQKNINNINDIQILPAGISEYNTYNKLTNIAQNNQNTNDPINKLKIIDDNLKEKPI